MSQIFTWGGQSTGVSASASVIGDHKMVESIDTCYNMDGPWKCYAKGKKSSQKPYTLSLHLYEKSKIGKSIEKVD